MTAEQIYSLFLKHPIIETDSRKIKGGCIFFALKGENFNGNLFAAEAISKGAAYAVIDEEKYQLQGRTILVKNVLETLQNLANYHRKRLGIPVLAITGSNGKTTTKELIATVLSNRFNVEFTQGNLNNHIGVPLSLLRMNNNTEIGIIEMGASHSGEIAALCAIADPDYGIITNIGIAHLEGFGSVEIIKKTKAELYNHINSKNGVIFYNTENGILSELASKVKRKIGFGEKNGDFTGKYIASSPYLHLLVNFPQKSIEIKTKLIGSYNFENIMAAACIGHYFKVNPDDVKAALSNYQPRNNRSQMIERGGLKLIMDAYNANPTSMKASIKSFVSVFQSPRILILGDMLELGEKSLDEHISVLEIISTQPYEKVFLVGPVFTEAAKKFTFNTFLNSEALIQHLKLHPLKKGVVLIKGSRGIQLEKVVECL